MSIRAVGFDYLGVLTTQGGGQSTSSHIAAITGLDRGQLYAAYDRHSRELQSGGLSVDELWALVAHEIGAASRTAEVVAAAHVAAPPLDPAMVQLVDDLRASGYRVGLLSNLSGQWVDDLRSAHFGRHFDAELYSSDIGLAKPDPRTYQLLAEQLGIATSELLFIDDSAYNLTGVEQLGITPVLFRGRDTLLRDLRNHDLPV
ncbi:MAG TPA: HAD family phosphatase [Candidatus Saccharimonas sp.]|nr:HAD family phosphatase [Candidatus Saccharimonas sp.]